MWQRGQPPGPDVLLERSQSKLSKRLSAPAEGREATAEIAASLKESLLRVASDPKNHSLMSEELTKARQAMVELGPTLSPGNRAPFGELSAQLRVMISAVENGTPPSEDALTLYAARTLNFLASELEVPARLLMYTG